MWQIPAIQLIPIPDVAAGDEQAHKMIQVKQGKQGETAMRGWYKLLGLSLRKQV